jgi:hypothetical protein
MGQIKTEDMDAKELFLGDFTQKGFYDALHFMRSHGGHK